MAEKLILLQSTGKNMDGYDPLIEKLPDHPSNLRVSFITTASNPEPEKKLTEGSVEALRRLGFTHIDLVDVDGKSGNMVMKELSPADVIFMGGGNVFYLLDRLVRSDSANVVTELVNNGVIYIGASAGSTVAGESIGMSTSQNIPGITDLDGMGLVPFSLACHFDPTKSGEFFRRSEQLKGEVIGITNEQALLMEGEEFTLIGRDHNIYLL